MTGAQKLAVFVKQRTKTGSINLHNDVRFTLLYPLFVNRVKPVFVCAKRQQTSSKFK